MNKKELLRAIPKVDELLTDEYISEELKNTSRKIVVECIRKALEEIRTEIVNGNISNYTNSEIIEKIKFNINTVKSSKLRKLINATGVVIHTNLGRSILCKQALDNVIEVAKNYNNLEYNLENGERGSRYDHIEGLIKEITGAEGAMVVNNNAAAVMLALNTICSGKDAIVSRGQLVEIGGSFRIPEVMKLSGANLVEVGTTNRTHLYDYENVIGENTGAILKVHTSNFKITGFTQEITLEELVELGTRCSIPVVEDIGSGVFINLSKYGMSYEPTVQESIKKGIDIVTFSGDKLLGGPQAGIIAGKKSYIEKMKKNQLTRALRVDKMTLAALEGTLKCYLDEAKAIKDIPTLNMILSNETELKKKAIKLKNKLQKNIKDFEFRVAKDYSMVGGGSMPGEIIESYVVKVKSLKYTSNEIEIKLRKNSICPIISRVSNNEIILDVRTIPENDYEIIKKVFLLIDQI